MPICIYCEKEKLKSEMTLEHVIPRSLGGAFAPEMFKTDRVCKRCNNNLGLFVDAGFEKSWFVTNWLQASAMRCYDPNNPSSLPLVCLGDNGIKLPGMTAGEVCETYLGPFGECVFWVRPHDKRMYWYAGGNPRTAKEVATRAYFFFSERSGKGPLITWLSFRDAFAERKVRKVFGTVVEVTGASPADIGFVVPDDLDRERISFLIPRLGEQQTIRLSMNMRFDHRFLAKLARGLGFCLFGEKVLTGDYAGEVRKALWYRPDEPAPMMRGLGTFAHTDNRFSQIAGHENAITIMLMNSDIGVAANINIGVISSATVMCADSAILTDEDRRQIGTGIAIALFPHLNRSLMLSLPDFVAHKTGHRHPELSAIEDVISRRAGYFRSR